MGRRSEQTCFLKFQRTKYPACWSQNAQLHAASKNSDIFLVMIHVLKTSRRRSWTRNEKLRLFFAFICKNSGEHLKNVSTRYGISKYLKENCGIDITSDIEFSSCKDVFRAVVVDLTKKGFASTDHKPPIAQEDLVKIYSVGSIVMNVLDLNSHHWYTAAPIA